MLSARAVALQGIGFTPRLVALQGFGTVELAGGRRPRRHRPSATFYGNDITPSEQLQARIQLQQDDDTATDLIITLLTKGFFDGNF